MSLPRSVPVKIPSTKVHREFAEVIRRAYSGQEHFIVERDGLPVVAIISLAEYQDLMAERAHREARLRRFEQLSREIGEDIQQAGFTEESLDAHVEAVRQQLHEEDYGDAG